MSYSETVEETFFRFSSDEEEVIHDFLEEHGYTWSKNAVCGSCCGMYADYIYVNGIGGKWKQEDKKELHELLKGKGISHAIDGYTISADPDERNGEFSYSAE